MIEFGGRVVDPGRLARISGFNVDRFIASAGGFAPSGITGRPPGFLVSSPSVAPSFNLPSFSTGVSVQASRAAVPRHVIFERPPGVPKPRPFAIPPEAPGGGIVGEPMPIHREILETIRAGIPIARDLGLIPPARNAGPAPTQRDRAPQAERGSPTSEPIVLPPGTIQRAAFPGQQFLPEFLGGAAELVPRAPGGVYMGGACEGAFHTTLCGNRRTNKVTLVADPMSGKLAFLVDAGTPSGWSKITLKKPRRHHHHHP